MGTKYTWVLGTAILASATIACGGDSDDSNGTRAEVNSGLPKDKPLSQVTDAELMDIGESLAQATSSSEFVNVVCNLAGAFAQGQPGAPSCAQVVAECKKGAGADALGTQLMATPIEIPATSAQLSACTATVGEFETCLTDTLKLTLALFEGIGCGSDPSTLDLDVGTSDLMSPATCQALEAKCPGVSGASEGGSVP